MINLGNFILGVIVGAMAGVFVMSLCLAASYDDRFSEKMEENEENDA